MLKEQMLSAFKSLIRESDEPVLVTFQKDRNTGSNRISPFTEVLQPEYKGKLRTFELDYHKSERILEHFDLPRSESAVIFKNGRSVRAYQGFGNVRKYLRALSQNN